MATAKQEDYTDSEGVKHIIQVRGRNITERHIGGNSPSFLPIGIYIDGKRWTEFGEMGMGDPIEMAKQWIEEQIKN